MKTPRLTVVRLRRRLREVQAAFDRVLVEMLQDAEDASLATTAFGYYEIDQLRETLNGQMVELGDELDRVLCYLPNKG
jgi:hypothetical protein